MELGALVCVPNGAPLCEQCPLASLCEAAAGTALELPHKAAPKARRIEPVTVVLAEDAEERFLLQQRPQKGLLAGLWQPLLWEDEALSAEEVCARLEALGLACESIEPLPAAKHIFSHIEWRMSGYSAWVGSAEAPAGCVWASREQLQNEYTLPGAFKAYKKKAWHLKKTKFAFLVVIFVKSGYNSFRIDRACAAERPLKIAGPLVRPKRSVLNL